MMCSVVWQDNQCVITNSSHMVNFYWDTDKMLRSKDSFKFCDKTFLADDSNSKDAF